MPILNYTTSVKAEKTVSEIQKALAKSGASKVMSEYDGEGILKHLSFQIVCNNIPVFFRLPARIDNIYVILQNDSEVPRKLKSREQASRVAWRIIKNWIEAQLALVEAEQADMVEVFLPYAQTHGGDTIYQLVMSNQQKMLGAPDGK